MVIVVPGVFMMTAEALLTPLQGHNSDQRESQLKVDTKDKISTTRRTEGKYTRIDCEIMTLKLYSFQIKGIKENIYLEKNYTLL